MRKPFVLLLLLSMQCFICGCSDSGGELSGALSTGVLTGTVRDLNGQALAGATVAITGSSFEVASGDDGAFVLNAPPGEHMLSANKDGFINVQRKVTVPELSESALPPISVYFVMPPQQADYASAVLTTAKDVYEFNEELSLDLTVNAGPQHNIRLVAYDVKIKQDDTVLWSKLWTYETPLQVKATESEVLDFTWDWSSAGLEAEFVNCTVEAKVTSLVDITPDDGAQQLPVKGSLAGQYVEFSAPAISLSLDNRP